MLKITKQPPNPLRRWWPMLAITTALALAGCSIEDNGNPATGGSSGGTAPSGLGNSYHDGEWATIANLDPKSEECASCHGSDGTMAPTATSLGHNIGLKNFLANQVENLTITKVEWQGWKGDPADLDDLKNTSTLTVTFTAGANFDADRNVSLNLARLAPNISQTQGVNTNNEIQLYDWTNYVLGQSTGNANAEPPRALVNAINNQQISVAATKTGDNAYSATFDLSSRDFGLHNFTVTSKIHNDTDWKWGDPGTPVDEKGKTYTYTGVLGVKVKIDKLSEHVQCVGTADETPLNLATAPTFLKKAGQTEASVTGVTDPQYQLCWWPDGTRFPAGMFVTDNDEIVVQFNPNLTHRLGMQIARPSGTTPLEARGTNAWFDFIPANNKPIDPETDATRDIVTASSCNSCHGERDKGGLAMHGGGRVEPQLCVTCHNPANFDATSARTADFKQMIHKIHRGSNLPSVRLAATDAADGLLVRYRANLRHNTRYPQGPTPGGVDGISNCVKCHMGEESKSALVKFAQEQGAGKGEDDVARLMLADVTRDGDNWRTSRSIEACSSCHDDVVWQTYTAATANNGTDALGDALPIDSLFRRYMPSLTSTDEKDWRRIHRRFAPPTIANGVVTPNTLGTQNGTHGRADYSCGGCHFSAYNADDNWQNTGTGLLNPGSNIGGNNALRQVNNVHNKLVRNALLSDRFELVITDAGISETGLTATYHLLDKKTNQPVANDDTLANWYGRSSGNNVTMDGTATLAFNMFFGWMEDSPDYTHSLGDTAGQGQPGSPTSRISVTAEQTVKNDDSTYTLTIPLNQLGLGWNTGNTPAAQKENKAKLEEMKAKGTIGTAVIDGYMTVVAGTDMPTQNPGRIRVASANHDFRFDSQPLGISEGRREVVDFDQTCKNCHMQLSHHGGNRTNNTQLCVVCHTPNMTDIQNAARRGKKGVDGQYEESEDFKRLIHAVHASGAGFRTDPIQHRGNVRPSPKDQTVRGHSFPGVLSNCQSCHIENDNGQWTYELNQLPDGMIGSSAMTGDWRDTAVLNAEEKYKISGNVRHLLENHRKMTPVASVCSSCHDAGYKTSFLGRLNTDTIGEGGPYIGSHWWNKGGRAPGAVEEGRAAQDTLLHSGK